MSQSAIWQEGGIPCDTNLIDANTMRVKERFKKLCSILPVLCGYVRVMHYRTHSKKS
jgi:hypothetical protein